MINFLLSLLWNISLRSISLKDKISELQPVTCLTPFSKIFLRKSHKVLFFLYRMFYVCFAVDVRRHSWPPISKPYKHWLSASFFQIFLFFEFVNSTSTAKQASGILCKLSVNWLYVAFCNRIFNFSLVLCLLWNGVGVVRLLCSSGYRLCSVIKCVVSSVLGNSSL